MLRRALLAIVVCAGGILSPARLVAQTVPVVVHCEQLRENAGPVEKALCSNPDILRANNEIDILTTELERTLTGIDRDVLIDSERPFMVTRNGCINAPYKHGDIESLRIAVRECVSRVLAGRKQVLVAAQSSPASIRTVVTQYADALSITTLLKYADLFVEKRVTVAGCMRLDAGMTPEARTTGRLLERCEVDARGHALTDSGPHVPVIFKSMNEGEASFLDNKMPFSWWKGMVQRDGATIRLFVNDILGNPLR